MKKIEDKKKIKLKKEARNRLMIAAASVAILAGLYGVGTTMAGFSFQKNREGMVQVLSKKFNVDKGEVEEVLKEYRIENYLQRRAEMKNRLEARLSRAVKEGRITNEQKGLILEKRKEMQEKINQDLRNWSEDKKERREQMENYREEMKSWAKENGIDARLVGIERGRK